MKLRNIPPALKNYTGSEGKRYQNLVNSVSENAFYWVAKSRRDKIQPFVQSNDIVLEYGVGTGWNLAELKCKRRMGYDVADYLEPELTKIGIEFVKDIATVSSSSIDVVICHHVLEHVTDPYAVLEEIKRLLKPNGKLLLFVPWEKGLKFRFFDQNDQNHHLFSWNCQSLGNLASSCGLKIQKCQTQTFGFDKIAGTIAANLCANERCFRLIRSIFHYIRHDHEIFLHATIEKAVA